MATAAYQIEGAVNEDGRRLDLIFSSYIPGSQFSQAIPAT